MKKNILLGFIIVAFSFLFIGNVKGDENSLPELGGIFGKADNANQAGDNYLKGSIGNIQGSVSNTKKTDNNTKKTGDNAKDDENNQSDSGSKADETENNQTTKSNESNLPEGLGGAFEISDNALPAGDNYFKGTDGTKGDTLVCVYKGEESMVKLPCVHTKDGNVSCTQNGFNDSIVPQWPESLEKYIKKQKSCPDGAGISGIQAYFGKSNDSSKAHKKYEECLAGSNITCLWLDFDYSFACNSLEKECKDKINSVKNKLTTSNTEKFKRKFQKDKDYTTREVKIDDGCGLFSEKATKYIKKALTYIIIAGVVLTLVLGMWDFIKAITGSEDKGMVKAWKRFLKRVVTLAVLIILPSLVAFLLVSLDLTGVNEGSIFCGTVDEE